MKKLTLIAIAGACAAAALVWSVPASADTYVYKAQDRYMFSHDRAAGATSVPEPATLALLALGLGGVALRRRRSR